MVLAEKNHPIPSLPKNDHCSPLTTTTISQWSTPDSGCQTGQGLSSPGERSTIWQLSEKSESSFPGAGWDQGDHSRWPLANWKGVKREVAAGPTCLRGKWTSQVTKRFTCHCLDPEDRLTPQIWVHTCGSRERNPPFHPKVECEGGLGLVVEVRQERLR